MDVNFYHFGIGDYAAATRHLTWIEDIAYRRMMDAYYEREAPLPLDRRAIYRLVIASTHEQREAVDCVLGEFFTQTETGWSNARCDEEIAKAKVKKASAQKSAAARWDANAMRTHDESDANACENICVGNAPSPSPSPSPKRDTPPTPMGSGHGFSEFWLAYPKKVSKAAAEKAWAKVPPVLHPTLMAALERQKASHDWQKEAGRYVPNAATWLNGKRWEDETPGTGSGEWRHTV